MPETQRTSTTSTRQKFTLPRSQHLGLGRGRFTLRSRSKTQNEVVQTAHLWANHKYMMCETAHELPQEGFSRWDMKVPGQAGRVSIQMTAAQKSRGGVISSRQLEDDS